MGPSVQLLIVSSPSGAGKTTLCRKLLERFSELRFSVSHTTRPPRPGEVDGQDYYFVDAATFHRMVEAGEFAEWAQVHGNCYGTSHAELRSALAEGRPLLLDVDCQGAAQIRRHYPGATAVFILPPSLAVLRERLSKRGTENPEALELRLRAAVREIEAYPQFDYLVVNDDLEKASEVLCGIYLAEQARRIRQAEFAEKLLAEAAADSP